MNTKKLIDCERTKLEKWSRFQLPNSWKSIGIILSLLLISTAIVLKIADIDLSWFREFMRRGILVGLLIVCLSKEKIEDEMIISLRAKAYALAFIFGVGFALIQPFVEFIVHNFLYGSNPNNLFSYFEILSFMLMMQIVFFEVLKRNR